MSETFDSQTAGSQTTGPEAMRPDGIRPLTLGEILDRTTQLYRRNFLSFAGIAALPTAVILAVMIPVLALAGIGGVAITKNAVLGGTLLVFVVLLGVVLFAVAIAATVISQAALVRASIAAFNGQTFRVREALKSAWPQFWRYLWLLILQGIFVGLIPGALAAVAIGIVFLLARAAGGGIGANAAAGFGVFLIVAAALVIIVMRALTYSLGMPACVQEDKPAWDSLERSKKLSKGARGRIFLMFLLVWLLAMVVSMIGYVPMMIVTIAAAAMGQKAGGGGTAVVLMVTAEILNLLVNFAIQTLITPVYMIGLVLFYFDQRIRTEGYDIEWMMQRAGLTNAAPASAETGHGQPPITPGAVQDTAPDPGTLNG
jgi:hypothetical protein